jgi:hypothetical protein
VLLLVGADPEVRLPLFPFFVGRVRPAALAAITVAIAAAASTAALVATTIIFVTTAAAAEANAAAVAVAIVVVGHVPHLAAVRNQKRLVGKLQKADVLSPRPVTPLPTAPAIGAFRPRGEAWCSLRISPSLLVCV